MLCMRHARLSKKASFPAAAWLCCARQALKGLKLPGDEQIGVDIIRRACEEPIRQIVQNSGDEGAIVIGKIRENDNAHLRIQRPDRCV